MFSSRSFIVSGLTFRFSSILSLFLCMVLESVLVSFFYKWLTSFPSTTFKEIVFSPLSVLAFFVEDKVSAGAWIRLWAFRFVPLICFCLCVVPSLFVRQGCLGCFHVLAVANNAAMNTGVQISL